MQLHCLELPCRACPGSAGEIIHAAKIPVSRTLRGSWTPPSNPLADHHHPWGTVGEFGHRRNLPGSEPRSVTPKPMFFLLPGFPITAIRFRVGKRTLPTPPFVFTGDFLPCRPTQHQPTRVPQSPPSPWLPSILTPCQEKDGLFGRGQTVEQGLAARLQGARYWGERSRRCICRTSSLFRSCLGVSLTRGTLMKTWGS